MGGLRTSVPHDARVAAPFGMVGVRVAGDAIVGIDILAPGTAEPLGPRSALAEEAVAQIRRYLADPRFRFCLPCAVDGTAFRLRVWAQIAAIAPGATRTYGEIAVALGSAARAVGAACGHNPVPLLVPCHRVVAAAGPGGFMHAGGVDDWRVRAKQWLLRHECA